MLNRNLLLTPKHFVYIMRKTHCMSKLSHRILLACIILCISTTLFGQQRFLTEHPRLLFTEAEEIELKKQIQADPLSRDLAAFLKSQADSICAMPQIDYNRIQYGASFQLLHVARAYVYRLGTLSLIYRLYPEQKYLDAINQTLLWICNYPDWNPSHYLDTAEMSTAVAIAYDWLFDVLPESTKAQVKKCLYDRAITTVLREYEVGKSESWAKRETNWNVVCNAGMLMAALAVAEDYPNELNTILDKSAHYMPNCLNHFAPDGVCYEGPSYWGYTITFLSIYLKAVIDNDNGRGGIAQLPGLSKTALYQKRTLSPAGRIFNFGNAGKGTGLPHTPAYSLLSTIYQLPEIATWVREGLPRIIQSGRTPDRFAFLHLPWLSMPQSSESHQLPRLEVYKNTINDIIVFNGDRNKKGSIFLIAKGGEPSQAHQQMDCGTFLIESEGICWTEDLGSDSYGLPGFWDYKPKGQRWDYLRNNNFSHNTLNIDHELQYSYGEAFVSEYDTNAAQPFARLDMTKLYKDQAKQVTRTFTMKDDFTMETEDAIELINPSSTAYWRAITDAQVEINGNKLHLTQDGKHFYMEIIAPKNATFQSFPATPKFESEKKNPGTQIIEATCKFDKPQGKIIIRMSSKK